MHAQFSQYGSPAQKLVEELGELIVEIQKGERFGYDDHNPLRPEDGSNRVRVHAEMLDVHFALEEFDAWLRSLPPDNKRVAREERLGDLLPLAELAVAYAEAPEADGVRGKPKPTDSN